MHTKIFFDSWNQNTIEHKETFKMLLLNRANKVLGITTISEGGLSGTVTDVRLIYQYAIKGNACGIIIAHNHPSGNINPSESDMKITNKNKRGWKSSWHSASWSYYPYSWKGSIQKLCWWRSNYKINTLRGIFLCLTRNKDGLCPRTVFSQTQKIKNVCLKRRFNL